MPQASRLEDELKTNFDDANISLIKDSGGKFEVIVDKVKIFDKLAISKTEMIFPKEGEITQKIKELK